MDWIIEKTTTYFPGTDQEWSITDFACPYCGALLPLSDPEKISIFKECVFCKKKVNAPSKTSAHQKTYDKYTTEMGQ